MSDIDRSAQAVPAVGSPLDGGVRPCAYAVMAFGRVQKLVVRADVADELACKWRESDPDAYIMPLYGPEALSRDCDDSGHDEGRCGNTACLRGGDTERLRAALRRIEQAQALGTAHTLAGLALRGLGPNVVLSGARTGLDGA